MGACQYKRMTGEVNLPEMVKEICTGSGTEHPAATDAPVAQSLAKNRPQCRRIVPACHACFFQCPLQVASQWGFKFIAEQSTEFFDSNAMLDKIWSQQDGIVPLPFQKEYKDTFLSVKA